MSGPGAEREAGRTPEFGTLAMPGVRHLHPYEPGKPIEEVERELGLSGVVKLASNESPLGPGPAARQAMREAIGEVERYPDGNGYYLKQALARRLGVSASALTLGNGSNDVLDMVARAFAGPGHEVIFSEHAFVVFALATLSVGATPVVTPARDWGHDLEAMRRAIGPATRLVFIANPNNPTGTWNPRGELEAFIRSVPPEVLVVVDQAYFEYVREPEYADCIPWVERHPNLIVTRTFSKAYGLAGLRLGYSVSHPRVADYLNRVRHPFNVNCVALAAGQAALEDEAHVARAVAVNEAGLRQLENGLRALGLEWIPSIGNFLSVDVGRPGQEVFEGLLREGVIVRPVGGYGMPNHLRISVGLPEENERCLEALARVLGRTPAAGAQAGEGPS